MASHNLFHLLHCLGDTCAMLVWIGISSWVKKETGRQVFFQEK